MLNVLIYKREKTLAEHARNNTHIDICCSVNAV